MLEAGGVVVSGRKHPPTKPIDIVSHVAVGWAYSDCTLTAKGPPINPCSLVTSCAPQVIVTSSCQIQPILVQVLSYLNAACSRTERPGEPNQLVGPLQTSPTQCCCRESESVLLPQYLVSGSAGSYVLWDESGQLTLST
jgi:hypothetical protein